MIWSAKERGQGLVEYAFLFVFVVIVVIGALRVFGISVFDLYSSFVPKLVEAFS